MGSLKKVYAIDTSQGFKFGPLTRVVTPITVSITFVVAVKVSPTTIVAKKPLPIENFVIVDGLPQSPIV